MRFDVVAVGAATIDGLTNLDSSSGARRKFDAALVTAQARRQRPEAVVTLLGEVDCGFLMWKRHEQSGAQLGDLVGQAVERYEDFLLRAQEAAPVVVLSAPLPTLRESSAFGSYAGSRRQIRATRSERTALVLEFNSRVKRMCGAIGATFLDMDSESVGFNSEVSALLVGSDPTDHHYNKVVYANTLQRRLAPILEYDLPSHRFG
jgi:hypothetical protein